MIQRIQSLFLAGIVLIAVALYFIPFSEKTFTDAQTGTETRYFLKLGSVTVTEAGGTETEVQPAMMLLIVELLVAVLALYIVFRYKNRIVQMKLCMFGNLLAIVMLILIFYYSEQMGQGSGRAHYLAGIYLAAVQVFLFMATRRAIRKDEMLVRAADRIR